MPCWTQGTSAVGELPCAPWEGMSAGADYDGASRRFGELPEWAQPRDGVVRRRELPAASPASRPGTPTSK
eukprot:1365069-Amphidinium_carterae.1